MKDFFKSASLLLGCILLSRFILPANITPLIAMAVLKQFLSLTESIGFIIVLMALYFFEKTEAKS